MKVHIVLYTSTETGNPEVDSVWAKERDANKRKKELETDPEVDLGVEVVIESADVQ